jgi:uncharacterized protein YeaO (DUF488 family)
MPRQPRTLNIRLKRAYQPPSADDGTRVLIDRLWPRGLRKADAEIDIWIKEIAPSTELRQWFGHDRARWAEFRRRYKAELSRNMSLVDDLRSMARRGAVTLVYSARDESHNQAVVVRGTLKQRGRISSSKRPGKRRARAGSSQAKQSHLRK